MSANSEQTESSAERLARLGPSPLPDIAEPVDPDEPQRRRCSGISKQTGERCTAWAARGHDQCAGHAGIVSVDPLVGTEARRKAAAQRREARESVRIRAARALDEDFDDVLAALRRGIKQDDASKAAKAASDYVSLVYGRQLQKPEDEKPATDPLDVATLTREDREKLKLELMAANPELAARFRQAS